jgi:hypothetical protein
LVKPNRDSRREWMILARGETPPRVVEADKPTLVVWSSIWATRPDDLIRFDLEPSGQETQLRWTLLAPEELAPDAVRPLRRRLNELINAQLRYTFGQ